jgi:hypothetical protein
MSQSDLLDECAFHISRNYLYLHKTQGPWSSVHSEHPQTSTFMPWSGTSWIFYIPVAVISCVLVSIQMELERMLQFRTNLTSMNRRKIRVKKITGSHQCKV